MTPNQIEWAKHMESKRHNLATEVETNRHNVIGENETYRHNYATEIETYRNNVAKEVETNRHNVAVENETNRYNTRYLNELNRHNVAQEAIGYMNAAASQMHAAAASRQAETAAYQAQTDRDYKVSKAQSEFMSAATGKDLTYSQVGNYNAQTGYYNQKADLERRGQNISIVNTLINGYSKVSSSFVKGATKVIGGLAS